LYGEVNDWLKIDTTIARIQLFRSVFGYFSQLMSLKALILKVIINVLDIFLNTSHGFDVMDLMSTHSIHTSIRQNASNLKSFALFLESIESIISVMLTSDETGIRRYRDMKF
jgi:hypothetical protein